MNPFRVVVRLGGRPPFHKRALRCITTCENNNKSSKDQSKKFNFISASEHGETPIVLAPSKTTSLTALDSIISPDYPRKEVKVSQEEFEGSAAWKELDQACCTFNETIIRQKIEKIIHGNRNYDPIIICASALELLLTHGRKQKYFDIAILYHFAKDFVAIVGQCPPCGKSSLPEDPLILKICRICDLLLQLPTCRVHPFMFAIMDHRTTLGIHPALDPYFLMFLINSNAFEAISLFLYSYKKFRVNPDSGVLSLVNIRFAMQCFDLTKNSINIYVLRILMNPLVSHYIPLRSFLGQVVSQGTPEETFESFWFANLRERSALTKEELGEESNPLSPSLHLPSNSSSSLLDYEILLLNQKSRFSGLRVPVASLPPQQLDILCLNQYLVLQQYLIYMINHNIPISHDMLLIIFQAHRFNKTLTVRYTSLFIGLLSGDRHFTYQEKEVPRNDFLQGFSPLDLFSIIRSVISNRDFPLLIQLFRLPSVRQCKELSHYFRLLPSLCEKLGLSGQPHSIDRSNLLPPHYAPIDSIRPLLLVGQRNGRPRYQGDTVIFTEAMLDLIIKKLKSLYIFHIVHLRLIRSLFPRIFGDFLSVPHIHVLQSTFNYPKYISLMDNYHNNSTEEE